MWVCGVSDDYGDTWTFYSVFAVSEEDTLFYMMSTDTESPWLKRIVLQPNTALRNYKPLNTGFVNLSSNSILDGSKHQIGSLVQLSDSQLAYSNSITNYDSFTNVVSFETDHLYRILDVWDGSSDNLAFLFVKTTEPVDTTASRPQLFINDWTLYRYNNGTILELGHIGSAFYRGSHYVTGACFKGDIDHVIYAKNDSEFKTVVDGGVQRQYQLQDGDHSLHVISIDSGAVKSDKVIKKSIQTIARPLRFDKGSTMILVGQYREGFGTAFLTWHFGIQFVDLQILD